MTTPTTPALALMLDVETLSLRPDAFVVQVGYCMADLNDPERRFAVEPHAVPMNYEAQTGRHVDPYTVHWWMQQAKEAQQSVFSERALRFENAWTPQELLMTLESLTAPEHVTVWASPAAFDLPIITSLCGKKPWHYRKERCLQTLGRTLDPQGKLMPPDTPIKHDAAQDAAWQLRYLLNLWQAGNELGGLVDQLGVLMGDKNV